MWCVLAIATLVTWLIAGAAGIFMFGTWLSHGGPGHQRARSDGLPPAVIFTHLGFGALGFSAWVSFLVTVLDWLACSRVLLLMPCIGFSLWTLTLLPPFPALPSRVAPCPHHPGP